MPKSFTDNTNIILFDGVCNFCNYWVNFILKRDKKNLFKFASLQSESGQKLLEIYNLPKDNFDSFILITNDILYKKSAAAFYISKNLSGISKIILPFSILPLGFTDFIYDLVAKNRYKVFGKREFCRVPTDDERNKFI